MKLYKRISIFLPLLLLCLLSGAQVKRVGNILGKAQSQTRVLLQQLERSQKNDGKLFPRSFEKDTLKLVPAKDWTSGFFPGILWYHYDISKKEAWKQKATEYTLLLQNEQFNGSNHDIGFRINCSFGNGYRLTGKTAFKSVIIQAAKTLSKRFNSKIGAIKSWDHRPEWEYPVIIDNMMNLELLFTATRLSGDSSFYGIAVAHANTTMRNHFRADNSSYHVIDYDTATGKVIEKATHQGYAASSAWARGQAWGLYGFTLCYRETLDPAYLAQAEKIASFILNHPNMPADMIPYWDYDVPNIHNEPRDVSAAAITASALYELATFSNKRKYYVSIADKILTNLATHYRSAIGENSGFLLLHSTGHKPAGSEIDVPMIYADYYYLEALLRSKKLHQ